MTVSGCAAAFSGAAGFSFAGAGAASQAGFCPAALLEVPARLAHGATGTIPLAGAIAVTGAITSGAPCPGCCALR